jgi:hypothetical protein
MSYGFNTETKSESTNKQFNPGIHSGVELESVEFKSPKKDGSGDPSLMFNFKGANGETFRHIEWAVGEQATDVEKSQQSLAKRVKHIITKFIPEEQAVLSGNSYAEFAKGVINLIGDNNKGKKVAIKLVYNDKGNLVFTKYVGFIALDAKDLRIGDKERITKTPIAPSNDDDLLGNTTEDLPF